jgi:acetate---CoA ligase (ADP-forming)
VSLTGAELVRLLAAPRQVAIIGASQDPVKPAGRPLDYLRRYGYAGRLIPVTGRTASISGIPTVGAITELEPGSVEAAVVTLPAPLVLGALREADAVGVKAAVVIASGFENRDSEIRTELDEFARSTDLRIIGPNCLGSLEVPHGAYLTFSSVVATEPPAQGRVGLVTQSGALGNGLLMTLIRRHVGLTHWVSTGDEVNVGALELVAGMLEGPDIDAVGLFLEGITDLAWLPRVEDTLREAGKRLFFLKAANGADGGAAAAGHTGRLVGSADACRAILTEIGAHEVATVGELADALAVASIRPDLLSRSDQVVGVVTVSGATGVMAADRIGQSPNLRMAQVSTDPDGPLGRLVRPGVRPANPLDVAALNDTTILTSSVAAMAQAGVCDVVVVVESGLAHDRDVLARELAQTSPVPVLLTSLSEDDLVPTEVVGRLAAASIPYLPTVTRAVDALSRCVRAKDAAAPVPTHESTAATVGVEEIARRMPDDFPWARWRIIDGLDAAEAAAAAYGYPLVLKAAGRTIAHRSELNAVGVAADARELAELYPRVLSVVDGAGDVLIAQQFARGFELMISAVRDVELGAVAFVRLGGVLAEKLSLQTVLWHGWPAEQRQRILDNSQIGELLRGYRGGPLYDSASVNDVITAALAGVRDNFHMLEFNPVTVRESGAFVVDAIAQL